MKKFLCLAFVTLVMTPYYLMAQDASAHTSSDTGSKLDVTDHSKSQDQSPQTPTATAIIEGNTTLLNKQAITAHPSEPVTTAVPVVSNAAVMPAMAVAEHEAAPIATERVVEEEALLLDFNRLAPVAAEIMNNEANEQVEYPIIVSNGIFYRKKIKELEQSVLIQDFYQTGEKRTNPFYAEDKAAVTQNNFNITFYKKLKINGNFILWFQNGQMEQKSHYENGRLKGMWLSWYANGQKKVVGRYKNGFKDGSWTAWYDNAKRMQKGVYHQGQKEGVWITWYRNGKKQAAGRYSEGEKAERWNYWSESGKAIKQFYAEVYAKEPSY